jgi:small-conductance mechanosensitive channel
MENLEFLKTVYAGRSLSQWVLAALAAALLLFVLPMLRRWALARVARVSQGYRAFALIRDLLESTRPFFIFALALWAALEVLSPHPKIQGFSDKALFVLGLVQVGIWLRRAIRFGLEVALSQGRANESAMRSAIGILSFLAYTIAYSLLVLVGLSSWGVDVTALIAGLGVGGIAVALAAQNILGDLFASLTIVLDRPFVIGDSVQVGDINGTVEHIGLKTTRIRALTGEQVVLSNSDMLQSRIRNFRRQRDRRVAFSVGVTYQTPPGVLELLPGEVARIIAGLPQARFERCHLKTLGAFSLDYEIVYWVLSPDTDAFMDLQQRINFALLRRFAELRVEFAYPTQTLFAQEIPAPRA